jgi:hypothetical protein
MIAPFWSAATLLRVGESNTLTLCATDHLLHTLAHGARFNAIPSMRWVADAVWLLRGESKIDWDRFIAQANALQLRLVASLTLAYLRDRHEADVPSDVLRLLRRRRSALEALEYLQRRSLAYPLTPTWRRVVNCCVSYLMQHSDRRLPALVIGFPAFLRERWSARTFNEVVWIACKKCFGSTS